MTPADRTKLTKALAQHVGAIAADLRAQMLAAGPVRDRAKKLHTDEQVGDDFDVWTDLLSRRAAVLWVLKTVYVRVLEDRKLLVPPRLVDPEAQDVLFDRLAPDLGDTAFLRWVFRDLASPRGGLPELFAPQPAEVAVPSNKCSEALIDFWRNKEADTGFQWSFKDEEFAGELMGDLYQDLDPVVKDRYALCQTPPFVRDFMLRQTLTPALAELGGDAVRLLDPACGSGHFLLDGLRRIVAATAAQHPDWGKRTVVEHALERVVGIDLNDYACALARARMVMTAAELAGVKSLAAASQFHPHVYWADGLEQIERDEERPAEQLELIGGLQKEAAPKAALTRPSVRSVLRPIMKGRFHVVVVNPPYAEERDRLRKAYHRGRVGSKHRYLSAYKEYGLGPLFVERALQCTLDGGYVGAITASNFMKGAAGKPFVEKVLSQTDVRLVVDMSGAILAPSGFETPTTMVFVRRRRPTAQDVRVLVSLAGDVDRPTNAVDGANWQSILRATESAEFSNRFIHALDVPRSRLRNHPWAFNADATDQILRLIALKATGTLGGLVSPIGFASFAGNYEAFYQPAGVFARLRHEPALVRPLVTGRDVRDWALSSTEEALTPYDSISQEPLAFEGALRQSHHLWRFRTALKSVQSFSGDRESEGADWWCWYRWISARYRTPFRIAFPDVATHCHFSLDRGGVVFNQTAPVIRLSDGADEFAHFALLAQLNSSVACFWLRRNAARVGGRSSGTKRQSEAWAQRLRFTGGLVERLPILEQPDGSAVRLAMQLDRFAADLAALRPERVLESNWSPATLGEVLDQAEREASRLRRMMVALQEELDWRMYRLFGLAEDAPLLDEGQIVPIASEWRPFAIRMARREHGGGEHSHWFDAVGGTPCTDLPQEIGEGARAVMEARLVCMESNPLVSIVEAPEYKRKWEPLDYGAMTMTAARSWLAAALERQIQCRVRPVTQRQLAATIQDDERFGAVAALYCDRVDFDVEGLVAELLAEESVPARAEHLYTQSGIDKRRVWEAVWEAQRQEDVGVKLGSAPDLPEFSQGSRGKSVDFLRGEFWRLRGKCDVPRERFIAFTEIPGRGAGEILYGWAGWTPLERVKALLALDEQCEDQGIALADRIALLDSAWRLLPDIARDDAATASRLKAELAALVGPDGPSKVLLEAWRARFPPPGGRARARRPAVTPDDEDDD